MSHLIVIDLNNFEAEVVERGACQACQVAGDCDAQHGPTGCPLRRG